MITRALVSFLTTETVFLGAGGPQRGRDAVAAAWNPICEAEIAPFSWPPAEGAVVESGDLGFSSGPAIAQDGSISMSSFRLAADHR